MSTQINVTVDQGGLLQRNKQQTTANRQAALDDDAAKQVQQSATEQREARQVPDGTIYRSTRIDRKPAANRFGAKSILFGPKYEPFTLPPVAGIDAPGTSGYKAYLWDTITQKGSGDAPGTLQASRFYLFDKSFSDSAITTSSEFLLSGGPSAANAYRLWASSNLYSVTHRADTFAQTPELDKEYAIEGAQWTAELFVKVEASAGNASFYFDFGDCEMELTQAQPSYFGYKNDQNNWVVNDLASSSQAFSAWQHLAVVYSSGTFSVFVGGQLCNSYVSGRQTPASAQFNQVQCTNLSADSNGATVSLYLSSFRLSAKARYSGNFIPPSVLR